METEKNKPKAYVLYEKSIKELHQEIVNANLGTYERYDIYNYDIDRGDMSEVQKRRQERNGWYRNSDMELRLYDDQIYKAAKKIMLEKMFSGSTNNIEKETFDEIMNSKLKALAIIRKDTRDDYSRLSMENCFEGSDEYGHIYEEKYEMSNDFEEFEEKVKDVKNKTSYSSDSEYVLLERIKIYAYSRTFENLCTRIQKQIKKLIRNELTYCLKNGVCIVPKEYLDRKEEGIKDWRETKASGNKNNSMEKRMLRTIVKNKKNYAYDVMYQIMNKIASNQSWSIPSLEVEGRYNATKTAKLVSKIFDNKKDMQYYINLTEEEINEKFRKYWKDKLMEAYNEVDEMLIVKRS